MIYDCLPIVYQNLGTPPCHPKGCETWAVIPDAGIHSRTYERGKFGQCQQKSKGLFLDDSDSSIVSVTNGLVKQKKLAWSSKKASGEASITQSESLGNDQKGNHALCITIKCTEVRKMLPSSLVSDWPKRGVWYGFWIWGSFQPGYVGMSQIERPWVVHRDWCCFHSSEPCSFLGSICRSYDEIAIEKGQWPMSHFYWDHWSMHRPSSRS